MKDIDVVYSIYNALFDGIVVLKKLISKDKIGVDEHLIVLQYKNFRKELIIYGNNFF